MDGCPSCPANNSYCTVYPVATTYCCCCDLLLPAGVLLAAGVLAAGCCGSTYRYVVSCIKTITRELGKSFPNITINLLY